MRPIVCGIDEAGRGPIAGPVTAAAVILGADFHFEGLNDSKTLTEGAREKLTALIIENAQDYAVGWAWPSEIDALNIHYATLLAMRRGLAGLKLSPSLILVDGKFCPDASTVRRPVIKGDGKIKEIMAASILAKTARDRWMIRYSWIDPRYEFQRHKGYPTKRHRERCGEHGLSELHRKSFTIL